MSFFTELKRRNVFRVLLTYAVAAWLLVEGMSLLVQAFEAPPWVLKMFIGVILLGALPVLIFSWVYEITPEGIRKESADQPEHNPATSRKLDIAVMAMLAVAIVLFLEQRFSSNEAVTSAPVEETLAVRDGPPMLAVLPFVSTGTGGESDFFATGVHDDLLTQLAQLQSIRVISRTSVLEYKDTVRNIREIGRALGADAILEGGVQSAGGQIRINAQLIDAHTDEHLWAQTYDRELSPTSIFDVQTEIARAITSAMQATLTTQDATQLTVLPTENMAAYRAYHRAMEIRDAPGPFDHQAFQLALESAVELDPTFTRAWAELAGVLSFRSFAENGAELIERAEQVLQEIQTLAPKSADNLIAQAFYTYYVLEDLDRAHQLISEAHDMMPSDARLLELKSWIERRQGDFDGMAESVRQARILDPRNSRWTWSLLRILLLAHQYDEAREEAEAATLQDYRIAYWRNYILLGDHHDINRWAQGMAVLQDDFEGEADPLHLWNALIASRNYADALNLLTEKDLSIAIGVRSGTEAYFSEMTRPITLWLMGRFDMAAQDLVSVRPELEKRINSDGEFDDLGAHFEMAVVTAIEGDMEETERLMRRWERAVATDLAEAVFSKSFVCRVLGIAGATEAAVECIRTGLKEPSLVMPFLEPFLPYYDAMREEPEFVELLIEIDGK